MLGIPATSIVANPAPTRSPLVGPVSVKVESTGGDEPSAPETNPAAASDAA